MIRPAIGMYVPGSTWLHRLDPRAKLAIAIVLSTALFSIDSGVVLGIVLAGVLFGFASARIPLRYLRSMAWPIAIFALFAFALNAIAWDASLADMRLVGVIPISYDGVARGLYFAVRLLVMVFGASLVTLTTSPVALTDAITSILSPLRRLRVPVDDIALVLSIALRFIPTIVEEADTIALAQRARGARFNSGSVLTRVKAWVPVLVPLLVQLFRRADSLALAMESRCYTGEGRTRLRQLHWRPADTALVFAAVAFVAMAGAGRWWGAL